MVRRRWMGCRVFVEESGRPEWYLLNNMALDEGC